jgi:hypothetical protein
MKYPQEIRDKVVSLRKKGLPFVEIHKITNIPMGSLATIYYDGKNYVKESPFVRYDDPPRLEGDWLVLPCVEAPFHDFDFLNRVLDLANVWGIKNLILAGDFLHNETLTGFDANFATDDKGLSDNNEKNLMDFIQGLPSKYQEEGMNVLMEMSDEEKQITYSEEMQEARILLKTLDSVFDKVQWVLGNHEGRILRTLQQTIDPIEILRSMGVDNERWSIAPYYYCHLTSGGKEFRIEHPKPFSANTAVKLASMHLCNILMAHSHVVNQQYDISGRFYAWHMGMCADEKLFAYEAQRSRQVSNPHKHGAVIVRDGFPYMLTDTTPWGMYKKMV